MTRFVYSDEGRLIEAVTTREPEFHRSDVDRMIALRRLDRSLGPHGHPMDEAMSPEANPATSTGWRYIAENPSTDFAALALMQAQEAYYKRYPDAPRGAHQWRVRRVDLTAPQ